VRASSEAAYPVTAVAVINPPSSENNARLLAARARECGPNSIAPPMGSVQLRNLKLETGTTKLYTSGQFRR